MRIRRYAARLLASATNSPSSAPPPPAAPWCCAADNDCAICELTRSDPQVDTDSGKQKGQIATCLEAELKGHEPISLAQQLPVLEAEECKMEDDTPVSEAAIKPEVTEGAAVCGDNAAALGDPRNVDFDSEVDSLRGENAGEVGAGTAWPFEDDASGSPVGDKPSSIEEVAPSGRIDASSTSCVSNIVARSVGNSGRTDIICYARRKGKRKPAMELSIDNYQMVGGFVHDRCEEKETLESIDPSNAFDGFACDPCESMTSTARSESVKNVAREIKFLENSAENKDKMMKIEQFECDIGYCRMAFKTRAELSVHKRNMCTVKSCSKHFRSHRYLRHHQCIHSDERPFKCPWEGCSMAFKWSWARIEHFQVHTGEKPYKCMTPGCSKKYKYVSDFSRHRRTCKHQR